MFCLVCFCSRVLVFAQTWAHFWRHTWDGMIRNDAHFTSHSQTVDRAREFDCDQLLNKMLDKIDNLDGRKSGFVLDLICNFTLVIAKLSF